MPRDSALCQQQLAVDGSLRQNDEGGEYVQHDTRVPAPYQIPINNPVMVDASVNLAITSNLAMAGSTSFTRAGGVTLAGNQTSVDNQSNQTLASNTMPCGDQDPANDQRPVGNQLRYDDSQGQATPATPNDGINRAHFIGCNVNINYWNNYVTPYADDNVSDDDIVVVTEQ